MDNETNLNLSLNENQVIHHLSGETTRLISSSQIISSVSSVVKECFENSLDAGATNIQVKLENFGLNLIEIKDDGLGISYENVQKMFLPGFTSKINDYSDLDKLLTYGFRGEALAAICQLGETSVTTKREQDALAMTYDINKQGEPSMSHPSHLPKGTTIAVKNLFKDLPVRKQYASSKKKMAEELKKIEHVVQSLAVIHPQLRVVITHNKSNIWQKNSVKSLKQSFMQVVGLRHASKMDVLSKEHDEVSIQLVVPRKDATEVDSLFSSNSWNSFLFINYRPITCKEISKVVDEMVGSHWQISDKHVLCLVSIKLPPSEIDVNLEPNKTKVLLNNLQEIQSLLADLIQNYYGSTVHFPQQAEPFETPCKKIRLDDYVMVADKSADTSLGDEVNVLCSQINKDNCTLASDKEKSELNNKFIMNCNKIVASTTTHLSRDDIQEKVSIPALPFNVIDQNVTNGKQNGVMRAPDNNTCNETYSELCSNNPNNRNEKSTNENKTILNFNEDNVINFDFSKNVDYESDLSMVQNENHLEIFEASDTNSSLLEPSSGKESFSKGNDDSLFAENPSLTKDAWSRGQVVLQNGKTLEGGAVLLTNHKLINSSSSSFLKESKWSANSNANKSPDDTISKELGEDVSKFNLSLESVSSQMGKKEHSGFTKFARIMRPKIIEGNPNIMFTDVSRMLVERWKLLSSDEKEYYETVAKAVDEERKIHRKQKIASVPAKPVKPQVFPLKVPKRPDRKKITFPVELSTIVNMRNNKGTNQCTDQFYKLVGQLHDQGNWILMKNQEISGICHSGLNELILFHKMISNFSIATCKLDKPEFLNESNLGRESWDCLLSLDSELNKEINRYIVTSHVIVKNGFRIEIVRSNSEAVSTAFLTEVPIEIGEYGISELKEVLKLYQENGDFPAMDKLRPSVVKNYISNEVKRMVKNNSAIPDRDEISTQLNTWQESLKHISAKCLHGHDIFVPIHTINNSSS